MIKITEKARSAAFWETVRTSDDYLPFREELQKQWETYCTGEIPAVKYTEMRIYSESGSRGEYERPYFRRRCGMNAAALLAMIYPEKQVYTDRLCDIIWAILDEYTWVLPAHAGDVAGGAYPEKSIDLFAAETGFALSETDAILGDRLPVLIRRRIHDAAREKIINPFLAGELYWEKRRNNWAAVCITGVAATFIYNAPEQFPLIRDRVLAACRVFLDSFNDDGICLEGFGYWHYGFGFFTCLRDMLLDFAPDIPDLFADPKIARIAAYPQSVTLGGGVIASFADSGLYGKTHLGLSHYLKHIYPSLTVPPRELTYNADGCGRWCLHLRSILWFDPALVSGSDTAEGEYYAPDSQILVRRSARYSFAAKGGNNAEPHNHNDIGSFIIAADGRQLLCDPGSGVYSKQYFGAERYLDFCTGSGGHSVPVVGGAAQLPGKSHAALAACDGGILTLDLSGAYDLPRGSIVRGFAFCTDGVVMTDRYSGAPAGTVEHFVAAVKPETDGDSLRLGTLRLKASADGAPLPLPAVTQSPKAGIYCIDYPVPAGTFAFVLDATLDASGSK